MRLHFPDGEHADIILSEGQTSVGSTSDNRIIITKGGVQAHHALFTLDARGLVLGVLPDGLGRTHVNARPVREMALVRMGDVVTFGAVNGLVKPISDKHVSGFKPPESSPEPKASDEPETRFRNIPPKAVLRGVSGQYFGLIVPIPGRLVIGRGSEADLSLDEPEMSRRHALLEVSADGLYLRDLGSANGTYVNGVQVRDACLYSGDQISFDRNRFLVEAPGLPQRPKADITGPARAPADSTQTLNQIRLEVPAGNAAPQAAPSSPATPESKPNRGVPPWALMLIGAALVVAAVLLVNAR